MTGAAAAVPPFPPAYRASGLLLHVTSLPSAYGIGDLGPAALAWVGRLREAGQRWWQALPLGPTGYDDSPYQCLSSFAGNTLLISPDALIEDELLLADQIELVRFAQFLLFRQGERLARHGHEKGVRLIGDLPFFVSPDSSDVWANPELFLLGQDHHLSVVAGVPPDYFSADGQLWGNPVYDWEALRERGYRWWVDRLRTLLARVDVIRLDHFRAFAAAWHVPAGASTARSGQWVAGPGAEFLECVEKCLGALPFVAEDLGLITPDVTALRDQFHLPGMRVLQFAFDGDSDNPYLPRNYVPNTVVYTGTHDNPTTRGWYAELSDTQQQNVWRSLGRSPGAGPEVVRALMHAAWESGAALVIAPLQDLLDLGTEAA